MRFDALIVTATILIAGCADGGTGGSETERRNDMTTTMVRHGLDSESAACVAEALTGRLTPSMYAEVVRAATADDIPIAWRVAVIDATAECAGVASAVEG